MRCVKNKSRGFGFFLSTVAALATFTPKATGCILELFADSWVHGPPYTALLEQYDLVTMQSPEWIRKITYGESVRGRPLVLYRIQSPDAIALRGRPLVIVTEATHGNEYLDVLLHLFEGWGQETQQASPVRQYLNSGGVMFVVPIINPDGYEARRRINAQGLDLNRDYPQLDVGTPGLASPEIRSFLGYVEQRIAAETLTLSVSVDYHCCAGALLYPWSSTRSYPPEPDRSRFEAVAKAMQRTMSPFLMHGPPWKIFGYTPEGTSKDYFYERYGTLGFTYEGRRLTEQWKIGQQQRWWNWIFNSTMTGGGLAPQSIQHFKGIDAGIMPVFPKNL